MLEGVVNVSYGTYCQTAILRVVEAQCVGGVEKFAMTIEGSKTSSSELSDFGIDATLSAPLQMKAHSELRNR
jgi:hypothetical protein